MCGVPIAAERAALQRKPLLEENVTRRKSSRQCRDFPTLPQPEDEDTSYTDYRLEGFITVDGHPIVFYEAKIETMCSSSFFETTFRQTLATAVKFFLPHERHVRAFTILLFFSNIVALIRIYSGDVESTSLLDELYIDVTHIFSCQLFP